MKILLLTAFIAFSRADVSHLEEYKNDNPVPQSSYDVPQGSVVGSSSQLTLPSVSGPLNFNSGSTDGASGYNSASAVQSNSVPSENFVQCNKSSENGPTIGLTSLNSEAQFGNENLETSNRTNSFNFSAGVNQESSSEVNEGHTLSDATFDQDTAGSHGPSFNFGANSGSGISGFGAANNIIHSQAGADLGQPYVSNSGASFNIGASGSQQSPGFGLSGSTYQEKISDDNVDDSSAAAAEASSTGDAAKHLYFFSAPEEEDEVIEAKYDLPAVPAKKSYKIIFIKAPIYKNQATITLPAPPQIEEKTLVYVLVRKHDGQPKVHFKESAQSLPSKPEVFFIRYKTQKEAEAAVAQIQSTHGASGQVIAHLPVGTQAVFRSPDGSIVHNSSSVDSRFEGSVNVASTSSGGFSLDSLGANSFIGANVANRISEQAKPQLSEEYNAQNGGGIAPSQSADADSASISAEASAEVSGTQQEISEETGSIIEDITTTETASSADNYSKNVEQKVGGSDNHGQDATTAGLYGGPKYKRFSGNKY